jgi:hypothetical protein
VAVAFKTPPSEEKLALFNLPADCEGSVWTREEG